MNHRTSIEKALTTGLLKDLSPKDRQDLISEGDVQPFVAGETVIRQGQPQQALYFVLGGALRACCHSDYSVMEVGLLSEGDCFGEMSLLDPLKASATIKGTEAGSLWRIDRPRFQEFLIEHPHAGVKLLTTLGIQITRRLRKAEDKLLRLNERPVGFDYDY